MFKFFHDLFGYKTVHCHVELVGGGRGIAKIHCRGCLTSADNPVLEDKLRTHIWNTQHEVVARWKILKITS